MILLCLIFTTFSAFALTPEDIRKNVLENFQLIQEAELKLKAAEGDVTANEGEFDHKLILKSRNRMEDKYENQYFEATIERNTGMKGIGLVAGHRQGVGTFPAYDGKYATSGAGEIFAGFSVPLLRNFSTDAARTNLEIAKIEKKQAEEQLRLKKNIYVHKALSLYYKFLLVNQKLKIRSEILSLAQSRDEMLQQKFKRGDVERVKLVDNQRSIDKRKDELLKARLELVRMKNQILLYLPNESENLDKLYPQEDLVDTKVDPTLPTETLPQISIIIMEKKKQEIMVKLREQEKLPGLSLDVLGAKELANNTPYDPESLQVGVKFDFPLENRKAEGKTVAESYKLKALEKNMNYLENEINQTFNYSTLAIKLHSERWQTLKGEAEKTMTMSEAERRRWQEGSSDLFTVNLREQDLAEVMIRKWTSWYEYHQNILDALLYSARI